MRLIERHVKSCEELVGVADDVAAGIVRSVSEMIASTRALAVALGGRQEADDEMET